MHPLITELITTNKTDILNWTRLIKDSIRMRRVYIELIKKHFKGNSQMLFLVGARQVGKTTITQLIVDEYKESLYLNWDVIKDRQLILKGQDFVENILPSNILRDRKPLIVFDEIHKYKDWKNYLKGFFDLYKNKFDIIVTGSARLDVYKAGGDSMMGRYFQYRIHPLSVGELANINRVSQEITSPILLNEDKFSNLYKYGGFPEPYLKARDDFVQQWYSFRDKQLFSEDIRDLSNIHEIGQLEVLAFILKEQVGQLLNRSSLSRKIQVDASTISRWITVLERFFFCYAIKPWSKNITRSLIKEPKIYLYDWSLIEDDGTKFENFIVSHLLKAVDLWNDLGKGRYGLYFIRNKDKKEVDSLVSKNNKPWFLVEAKLSANNRVSSSLQYFQDQLQCSHAFQVVFNLDYVNKNCFEYNNPVVVPASTFLSQLV